MPDEPSGPIKVQPKPQVLEALRFTGTPESYRALAEFLDHGTFTAAPGDWIVRGPRGVTVHPSLSFHETYEEI